MKRIPKDLTSEAFGGATVGILSGAFFEKDGGIHILDKRKSEEYDQEEGMHRRTVESTSRRAKMKRKLAEKVDGIHRPPPPCRLYISTVPPWIDVTDPLQYVKRRDRGCSTIEAREELSQLIRSSHSLCTLKREQENEFYVICVPSWIRCGGCTSPIIRSPSGRRMRSPLIHESAVHARGGCLLVYCLSQLAECPASVVRDRSSTCLLHIQLLNRTIDLDRRLTACPG